MTRLPLAVPLRLLLFVLGGLLVACGGGGGSSTWNQASDPSNPSPSIQSLSPSSLAAGNNGFVLTISGWGFGPSSTLTWNGSSRTATLVSGSQLTVQVSAADLATTGNANLVVTNPSPGGGQAFATFNISAPAAPTIMSVIPNAISIGSGTTLIVTGANFVQNSTVQWSGASRPTTYVSNTQLTAALSASDVATVGTVPVTIMTPSPGGGTSSTMQVQVQHPLPSISALSPSIVTQGSPGFTLTVDGAKFVSGALVYWNGIARVTQYVGSTQLTASILANDVVTGNAASVTVQNPSPSAGISNVVAFVIGNAIPQISSVNPTSSVAGVNTNVDIVGTGFLPNSTVTLDNMPLLKSYVSSTHLSVFVVAPVGRLALAVSNPPPGGGNSNPVSFEGKAAGPPGTYSVVSVDVTGNIIDGNISSMSRNGRYVGFGSGYLRDTCYGVPSNCVPSTISSAFPSWPVAVSNDGRKVASQSGGKGSFDLNLSDNCLGASPGCTQLSNQVAPLAFWQGTSMSSDARYIAFLVYHGYTPSTMPLYLQDTCIAAPPGCTPTTLPIDNGWSRVSMSADGRYLAYDQSNSSSDSKIVFHDSCIGSAPGCAPSTRVISDSSLCGLPSLSSDGQYASFICSQKLYLANTCAGSTGSCTSGFNQVTSIPALNALVADGGRFVVFDSDHDLQNQQLDGYQVFVSDTCIGTTSGCTTQTVPVCLTNTGAVPDNRGCVLRGISSDGKAILTGSYADNLVVLPSYIQIGTDSVLYMFKNPLP